MKLPDLTLVRRSRYHEAIDARWKRALLLMVRSFLALSLILVLGCTSSGPDRKRFLGDWVTIGDGAGTEIAITFTERDLTITPKGENPYILNYEVETLADWQERRARELGRTQNDFTGFHEMATHVVTAFEPGSMPVHDPAKTYFYHADNDTLMIPMIVEFRRAN